MPGSFMAEVLTPERSFFCGEVQSIIVPAADGMMSIQKMHEPVVIAIIPGTMQLCIDGEYKDCYVSSGFVEVRPDETIVFAQTAEWPEEIDVNRAERAKIRAEERLRQQRGTEEYRMNKVALARALARLKVGRRNINL